MSRSASKDHKSDWRMISVHDVDGTVLQAYPLETSGKLRPGTFKRQKRRILAHRQPNPIVVIWHTSDTSEDPNLSGGDDEILSLCDTWLATTVHDDCPGETFHGVDMEGS